MSVEVVERYHVPGSQVWPGSRGGTRGNVHLHVVADVQLGRRRRLKGECLCSKKHGSYERPLDPLEIAARCPECDRISQIHQILWPSEDVAKMLF